jgi:hypothetical protein
MLAQQDQLLVPVSAPASSEQSAWIEELPADANYV